MVEMRSNYKVEKYYLHFVELGNYDCLEYYFDTMKGAEDKFKELKKEHKEYFSFIAEIKVCRRKVLK